MSHSAKASTTLKGKKLDLVQEEKTTEPIPNKKNMLAASASPQTQQARNKRSVVSPDRELVPPKKNKKKKSKNTLGSPPDDGPIIASLTEEYMKEMQNQLLEKQTVMNKDSKANFTNIIYKHRVTSKVTAPMNSLADFQITPTLKQKASLKASIDKYPVLKNQELVNKFMAVPMTNNQKGRIRQVLREIFKGTSETLLPDVINNRIQAILKSSPNLTDIDLRKIRILYNMLKKSTENKDYTLEMEIDSNENEKKPKKRKKGAKKVNDDIKKDSPIGSKRYVLFIGNLPLAVTKEQILDHFWDLRDSVKDVRLPKRDSSKKTAIAYIELMNEPSYELALSKHHTMLGNRRISIQYTTQKNGKVTKAQAKSKSAKLQALIKKGKIIGSIEAIKKRSARRAKARNARKLAESAAEHQNLNSINNARSAELSFNNAHQLPRTHFTLQQHAHLQHDIGRAPF